MFKLWLKKSLDHKIIQFYFLEYFFVIMRKQLYPQTSYVTFQTDSELHAKWQKKA